MTLAQPPESDPEEVREAYLLARLEAAQQMLEGEARRRIALEKEVKSLRAQLNG